MRYKPIKQQSDYTRTKDNKTCWNAVKELAQVGGARKLLRKYYMVINLRINYSNYLPLDN